MTRFKPIGQQIVVQPEPSVVEAISVRDLSRETSAVLRRLREARRFIVTKRSRAVAVILDVDEAIGLCAMRILPREEAERRLYGEELAPRVRQRPADRMR